jgi:hypothetical protein
MRLLSKRELLLASIAVAIPKGENTKKLLNSEQKKFVEWFEYFTKFHKNFKELEKIFEYIPWLRDKRNREKNPEEAKRKYDALINLLSTLKNHQEKLEDFFREYSEEKIKEIWSNDKNRLEDYKQIQYYHKMYSIWLDSFGYLESTPPETGVDNDLG